MAAAGTSGYESAPVPYHRTRINPERKLSRVMGNPDTSPEIGPGRCNQWPRQVNPLPSHGTRTGIRERIHYRARRRIIILAEDKDIIIRRRIALIEQYRFDRALECRSEPDRTAVGTTAGQADSIGIATIVMQCFRGIIGPFEPGQG